jgi:hypothetical protein
VDGLTLKDILDTDGGSNVGGDNDSDGDDNLSDDEWLSAMVTIGDDAGI